MDGLRVVASAAISPHEPCCRCRAEGSQWDRVNGLPCCPDCQESLVQGEGDPLTFRTERRRCVVCGRAGSVRFLTMPLRPREPVEMDLCATHVRGLLARNLDATAYAQLRRQLSVVGLSPRGIFLLHEAFYDDEGRALQPAVHAE
jgi:hypothetical protein